MSNEVIYGIHAVQAVLATDPSRFIEVMVLKGRQDERLVPVLNEIAMLGVSIQQVGRKALDDKTQSASHQGIVARVKPGRQYNENDLDAILTNTENPLLLVLDGVTDPHNLGACLRTADAAGVSAVIVPKDKSAQLNATARKVACGAAEVVPLVRVTNLARAMRTLKEQVYGSLAPRVKRTMMCMTRNWWDQLALVMGAEGEGMRRLTRETCDELIRVPMAGSVSSLNVSVATGVCLYEAVRQRR
ncbi:23S rRNA (guanosine(2251)-2'-O)-methyltransferase RlmB [Salinivibrio socompensis]|uniref:23S rRNA (guanosine(2251)-2'-O)-methyltransferase RlmB n=1 Tax=Salinivibrio socompensis TaxID=1510206 RepID=UPI0004B40712|nr:23S rRNA (guanosine(2251)-2'-O)-methyltransferase RlmB [Salinivibrio socompensis]